MDAWPSACRRAVSWASLRGAASLTLVPLLRQRHSSSDSYLCGGGASHHSSSFQHCSLSAGQQHSASAAAPNSQQDRGTCLTCKTIGPASFKAGARFTSSGSPPAPSCRRSTLSSASATADALGAALPGNASCKKAAAACRQRQRRQGRPGDGRRLGRAIVFVMRTSYWCLAYCPPARPGPNLPASGGRKLAPSQRVGVLLPVAIMFLFTAKLLLH
jgi:hypothetical protein